MTVELEGATLGGRFVERHSGQPIQHIDAYGCYADLEHAVVCGEVGLRDLEGVERRTERFERAIDPRRVRGCRADEDVDVLRRARG